MCRLSIRTVWLVFLVLVLGCEERIQPTAISTTALHLAASRPAPDHHRVHAPRPRLTGEQIAELSAWFGEVDGRRDGESFGDLIVRAARRQLQKPYDNFRQTGEEETLHVDLQSFQCVSLVESSLAVARCVWRGKPDEDCFLADVQASRYRNGRIAGYASRLHYFPDWLLDNEERGRVVTTTADLGGVNAKHAFSFMTTHRGLYPPLTNAQVFEQIQSHEKRLSAREWMVLGRDQVVGAEAKLENGDIVALVSTKKPGLLIGHTGFIDRSPEGVPRLLHASSYHKRVLLTVRGIANYVHRRPYRQGIMVARPLPPPL